MSIARLKRERKDIMSKLKTAIQQEKSGGSKDDRFWKPTFDETKGTGSAKIRFLPAPEGEALEFIKLFDYGFKGPSGKWFIENSPTTIQMPDPLAELNSRLWNSGVESDKDVMRKQKRRKKFISNILVIEDPANPENNGQVKLYQYGPAIYEMLQLKLTPEFEDEDPINPFDLWEGADFNIRIRMKEGYRSYDKSFWTEGELFPGDDDAKEEVYNKCHSLEKFIAPENFKSYDELQKKLLEVLGEYIGSGIEVAPGVQVRSAPAAKVATEPKVTVAAKKKKAEAEATEAVSEAVAESSDDIGDLDAFLNDF